MLSLYDHLIYLQFLLNSNMQISSVNNKQAINTTLSQNSRVSNISIMIFCMVVVELCNEIYLPSLSEMSIYFGVSMSGISNAISLYFVGASISLMVFGSLSDMFGRRKIIIFGSIVSLSSFVIWLSNDISVFLQEDLYKDSVREYMA